MPIKPLETDRTREFAASLEDARRRRKAQAFEDEQRKEIDTLLRVAEGLAPVAGATAGGIGAAVATGMGAPQAAAPLVGAGTEAGRGLSGAIGVARSEAGRKREDAALEGSARRQRIERLLSQYG